MLAIALLGMFVLGLAPGGSQDRGELPRRGLPDRIEAASADHNARWISAASLIDQSGRLRRDLLPDDLDFIWRRYSDLIDEANSRGNEVGASFPCIKVYVSATTVAGHERPKPESLKDLLRAAVFAIHGVIRQTHGGFAHGRPATMLEVATLEILKMPVDGSSVPDQFFFSIPIGEVRLGAAGICPSHKNWERAPSVGDEVFIFPRIGIVDVENRIVTVAADGSEIVYSLGDDLVALEPLAHVDGISGIHTLDAFMAELSRLRH